MVRCIHVTALLVLVFFPGFAYSQQYKATLVKKGATIGETVISSTGESIAIIKNFNTLQTVSVSGNMVTGSIAFSSLPVENAFPLAVNDLGQVIVSGKADGDESSRCLSLLVDVPNNTTQELFEFSGFFDCRPNTGTLGDIAAAINNAGTAFFSYNRNDGVVYSYYSDGMLDPVFLKSDITVPPRVRISDSGEASSFVPPIGDTDPSQLLFYSPDEGLSLHSLPEEIRFRELVDFHGNFYLLGRLTVNDLLQSSPFDLYQVDQTKNSGTFTTLTLEQFKNSFGRQKRILKGNSPAPASFFGMTREGSLLSFVFASPTKRRSIHQAALTTGDTSFFLPRKTRNFPGKSRKARMNKYTVPIDIDSEGNIFIFINRNGGLGSVYKVSLLK